MRGVLYKSEMTRVTRTWQKGPSWLNKGQMDDVVHLALVEEPLVVLGIAGRPGVGLSQSDQLADVSVLVSLQLGPARANTPRGRGSSYWSERHQPTTDQLRDASQSQISSAIPQMKHSEVRRDLQHGGETAWDTSIV